MNKKETRNKLLSKFENIAECRVQVIKMLDKNILESFANGTHNEIKLLRNLQETILEGSGINDIEKPLAVRYLTGRLDDKDFRGESASS